MKKSVKLIAIGIEWNIIAPSGYGISSNPKDKKNVIENKTPTQQHIFISFWKLNLLKYNEMKTQTYKTKIVQIIVFAKLLVIVSEI